MTPEERAGKLVGDFVGGGDWFSGPSEEAIAQAIRDAVEEERAACERIAAEHVEGELGPDEDVAEDIAHRIRARGKAGSFDVEYRPIPKDELVAKMRAAAKETMFGGQ